MSAEAHEQGAGPLNSLMTRLELTNADLVKASTEQLTFKMVQKARKGKPLTLNVQKKILDALRTVRPEETTTLKDLFKE